MNSTKSIISPLRKRVKFAADIKPERFITNPIKSNMAKYLKSDLFSPKYQYTNSFIKFNPSN